MIINILAYISLAIVTALVVGFFTAIGFGYKVEIVINLSKYEE